MSESERLYTVLEGLPLDRQAAAGATLLAVLTVGAFLLLQMGVTAAMTGGTQPMAVVDEVPREPAAVAWEDTPEQTLALSKQQMAIPYGGGSVDKLDVQVATNESHVAVRMEWADPTRDANLGSPENFSDAGAVMFANGDLPPITMGAVGEPVNIWYWRASWQENTSAYGAGDMYSYEYDRAGTNTRPAEAAGNPLSKARYEQFAQNYYAAGFGSTSHAPAQPVHASGTRTDDGWAVTFVRERGAGGEHDVNFDERPIYMAFAVWNGSADERNGKKSLTLQYQQLDPETGELTEAQPSSGSDSGDSGDGGSAGDGSDGGRDGGMSVSGWVAVLLISVLTVWTVSYWRLYD